LKDAAGIGHNPEMSERPYPVPPLRIPFESLTHRFGGYDRAAIERLLEELSGFYEALWVECATLRESEAELKTELARREEAKPPAVAHLDDSTASAAAIEEDARREAQLALKKARENATKTVRRMEREARARAEEILSEARRERREIELETERMGTFASETREELSSFLLAALKWYMQGLEEGAPAMDLGLGDVKLDEPRQRSEHVPEMHGELQEPMDSTA
jgi:cell division septum initiation protein DivIVA